MYHYTFLQWLLFFFTYCFLGWCWETTYVSIKNRKFINRGFMYGPFLPIYGTGAIMMLVVSAPFQQHPGLTFIAGMIGATVLELVTGTLMETLFKVRYWDYSKQRFNYKGYICLSSSIAWGLFTVLMTGYLHRPVEWFVQSLPERSSQWLAIVLSAYAAVDFSASFRGAINLRNLLDRMERVKEELAIMERRLDAIIAFTRGVDNNKKKEAGWYKRLRLSELKSSVSERFASIKLSMQNDRGEMQEELSRQEGRFRELLKRDKTNTDSAKKGLWRRIFDNPTMVSKRYQESLNELKQIMSDNRKNRKDR